MKMKFPGNSSAGASPSSMGGGEPEPVTTVLVGDEPTVPSPVPAPPAVAPGVVVGQVLPDVLRRR